MSCNSALYGANTASQSFLAAGTTINFGTPVRRYGQNISMSGGNVLVYGKGYYDVTASVSFEATTAGPVTIQLYNDGMPINGAQTTVTAEASTTYSVCIPAIIRETCCCESAITAVISGVPGSVSNASIVVEKI